MEGDYMKKKVVFIFLFLIISSVVFFGCEKKEVVQINQQDVVTPIDNDVGSIDDESSELDESDLNNIEEDLQSIEDL